MSTVVPPIGHRQHRHTQSAVAPPATASSQNPQNPQNPHYLNLQSQEQNSQSEMSDSYQSTPTTPPRTPPRNDQPSSKWRFKSAGFDNGSNKKPRKDRRPRNAMESPATVARGRNTPPSNGFAPGGVPSSAKAISTPTAYAGATFHASPAPSALPIPSFYSKSVPDSPGLRGLKLKDATSSDSPTPPVQATNTPIQQKTVLKGEESPLDVFFKADRAEKARARSASSSQNTAAATGPFNPPFQSPVSSHTPPAPGSHGQARYGNRASPGAMFAMELDGEGTAASPIGPAFSTPYAQRINAARPQNSPQQVQAATDRSQALKAYLFSGPSLSPASPAGSPTTGNSPFAQPQPAANHLFMNPQHQARGSGFPQRPPPSGFPLSSDQKQMPNTSRQSGRNSGLRQEVTPTKTPTKTPDRNIGYASSPTPSRAYGNTNASGANGFIGNINIASPHRSTSSGERSSDIEGMEESLRRILKLGPSGSPGASGHVGNMPAATASVPNYVGGRDPPMNGMHNGVMGS